jgi:hypothetical protein
MIKNARLFSQAEKMKIQEAVLTEKIVQGQKSHHLDGQINQLMKVQEARTFYYTQLPKLQDHHFVMIL